jgi:hypothetical protein
MVQYNKILSLPQSDLKGSFKLCISLQIKHGKAKSYSLLCFLTVSIDFLQEQVKSFCFPFITSKIENEPKTNSPQL